MKSILNFFKYHNAVPLLSAVVVLGAGVTLAASPELRQSVFSPGSPEAPKILPPEKTDTTNLLAINPGKYDFGLRIDAINEDPETYFVSYSYKTLEVVDGAWREVRKSEKLTIPKKLLGKRDLKEYLSDQIGQVVDRQIAYLTEVQSSVSGKAASKSAAKEYASLIGKGVDVKQAVPSGDGKLTTSPSTSPDVTPSQNSANTNTNQTDISKEVYSKEEIHKMIVAAVADFLSVDMSMPDASTPPSEVPGAPSQAVDTASDHSADVSQTPVVTSQTSAEKAGLGQ